MPLAVKDLNYIYNEGTAMAVHALTDISFSVGDGEFLGIIGHTGSGKSTLIQHLNGLIRPTSGKVLFNGQDVSEKGYPIKELRQQVGLVFQYPEHQLFEENVLADVCFGPKNQGLSPEECEERAREALRLTGVEEDLFGYSPFELSGGQKRRVAIAGVLAMRPKFLILDEPTAGLDPQGRGEILRQIRSLHEETGMGVILVSHSMEDVAEYVERILVVDKGTIRHDGTPREVFGHYKELEELGLAAPQVTYIMHALRERGIPVDASVTRVEEAVDSIMSALAEGGRC